MHRLFFFKPYQGQISCYNKRDKKSYLFHDKRYVVCLTIPDLPASDENTVTCLSMSENE